MKAILLPVLILILAISVSGCTAPSSTQNLPDGVVLDTIVVPYTPALARNINLNIPTGATYHISIATLQRGGTALTACTYSRNIKTFDRFGSKDNTLYYGCTKRPDAQTGTTTREKSDGWLGITDDTNMVDREIYIPEDARDIQLHVLCTDMMILTRAVIYRSTESGP